MRLSEKTILKYFHRRQVIIVPVIKFKCLVNVLHKKSGKKGDKTLRVQEKGKASSKKLTGDMFK